MREITEQEGEDARKVFPKITDRTAFIPVTEKKFPMRAPRAKSGSAAGAKDAFIVLIAKEVDGRKFLAWYWEAEERCYYYVLGDPVRR